MQPLGEAMKHTPDLESVLKNNSLHLAADYLIDYIENNDIGNADVDIICGSVIRSDDVDAVADIITALSFRRVATPLLQKVILSLAAGNQWDAQERVKLQAIFALPRVCRADNHVKNILKTAFHSDNIVIRDAALVAAQAYCGVVTRDINWGNGKDNLVSKVDTRVIDWLNS
jgi:hypothetical protein